MKATFKHLEALKEKVHPATLDVMPKHPIGKWMMAKPIVEEVSTDTIIETIYEKNKKHRAKIVMCGPQVQYTSEGDVVCYTHNIIKGLEFDYKGEKLVFLHEDKHCLFLE